MNIIEDISRMLVEKFQIGEDAYIVRDYKITPVRIDAIITEKNKNGTTLKYRIFYPNNKQDQISGSFLIGSWKESKKLALSNLHKIYKLILKELETSKSFSFDQAKEIVAERLKVKKNV